MDNVERSSFGGLYFCVGGTIPLAAEEPGLSPERVDQILASGKTVRLKLTRPVPVRLMYLTAVPTGDTIAYPPDVYGWDAKLLALLDRYEARRRRR